MEEPRRKFSRGVQVRGKLRRGPARPDRRPPRQDGAGGGPDRPASHGEGPAGLAGGFFPAGPRSSRKSPALSGRGGLFSEEPSSSGKNSALPDSAELFLEEIDPSAKSRALPGKVGLCSIPGAGEMSLAKGRQPSRRGNVPGAGKAPLARGRCPRAREL